MGLPRKRFSLETERYLFWSKIMCRQLVPIYEEGWRATRPIYDNVDFPALPLAGTYLKWWAG